MFRKALFVALFLIINLFSILYLYRIFDEHREDIIENETVGLSDLYQSAITTFRLNARAVFDNIIMQPDVLSVLRRVPDADAKTIESVHDELYGLLQHRYENLKSSLYVRQLHFHLGDGRSLLRMHRPNKYGDPLFDVRYTVKVANTKKRYVEGFEEGRIFNGYRYVYPIIDLDGTHLGSVEISVSMSAIIYQLTQIFRNRSFYFMIDKDIIQKKVFRSEKSNYLPSKIDETFVVDNEVQTLFDTQYNEYLEAFESEEDRQRLAMHRSMVKSIKLHNVVLSTFLPIYNVEQRFVAYLVSFEKNTHIRDNRREFIYQVLFSLIVTAFALVLLYYFMERSHLAALEKRRLDKLVQERTEALRLVQEEKIQSYRDIIFALVNLTEERDTYTAGHTRRVAEYSKLIAEKMGYSQEEVKRLYEAAVLHDIGKIVTPDSVLLKPGGLNYREYEIIKGHVLVGESILKSINLYSDLVDIVKNHHERYDGSGYPYGLKGDAIPPLARILAVADTFDAMTTNRIYKPRKEVDVALAELRSLAGVLFDAKVVEAAIEVLQNIHINVAITQLPTNVIEEERLSHFFKDPLTGLYNLKYLHLILQHGLDGTYFTCANIISIEEFTRFNNSYGWEVGDTVLVDLAAFLVRMNSESLVFRVFGDDFIVLNKSDIELSLDELQSKFDNLCKYEISLALRYYHMYDDDQRKSFIKRLEDAIG